MIAVDQLAHPVAGEFDHIAQSLARVVPTAADARQSGMKDWGGPFSSLKNGDVVSVTSQFSSWSRHNLAPT